MRHRQLWAAVAAVLVVGVAACSGDDDDDASVAAVTTTTRPSIVHRLDDTLRLHQVQVLGSHNSYHSGAYPEVLETIRSIDAAQALALEYSHRPLPEQFDELGIRQIELDVWSDPAGGAYADPQLPRSVGVSVPDEPAMREPGFKVLHEAEFDTPSTCLTFVACLAQVQAWSSAHRGHVPIMVEVEMKGPPPDPAAYDALDAEIRSVFEEDELVTPDDVRGTAATLGEAIATVGWPTLGEVRGQIFFTLDNQGLRDAYRAGHASLAGRVLFTPSSPGEEDAAFAKLNDPIGDADLIEAALAANMLVRTRADADTLQARGNDTTMREAALNSGAQFVSTDYEEPNPALSDYVVRIPGGSPARCNPVTAPPDCRPTDVEDPRRL